MAATEAFSFETAKPSFDVVLKQSELLGSWSLAVFGGCVTIIAWYIQRRMDHPHLPNVRRMNFVFSALILQGFSILVMYLAYGGIIGVITQLEFKKFVDAEAFVQIRDQKTSFSILRYLFIVQFLSFFLGITLLGLFMASNYRAVNALSSLKRKPSKKAGTP